MASLIRDSQRAARGGAAVCTIEFKQSSPSGLPERKIPQAAEKQSCDD
jgi:hypothetical protein